MPNRPRRPAAGSGYGGGRGFGLGSLLHGIFGGVEANPEYGQTEDFGEFGPEPLAKGGGDPFKARSILDRAEAARMNALAKYEQAQMQEDSLRELAKERSMNPILAEREGLTGAARNTNAMNLERGMGPIKATNQGLMNEQQLKLEEGQAGQGILKALGIVPTRENIAQYQGENNRALFDGANATILGRVLKALQENDKTQFDTAVAQNTSGDRMKSAQAGAFNERMLTEGTTSMLPDIIRNRLLGERQAPELRESQLLTNRMHSLPLGTSLFDSATGQLRYDNSDPEKRARAALMQKELGQQELNAAGIPATPAQASPRVVRPEDIVIIDGKQYIRR